MNAVKTVMVVLKSVPIQLDHIHVGAILDSPSIPLMHVNAQVSMLS